MNRPGRKHEGGFTLIEMLVALSIFALAALTLLRMEGASLSQTADLDARFLKETVAQNLAVEWMTDPRPPSLGNDKGKVENYGRSFEWQRNAELIADDRLVRITVQVREGNGAAVSLQFVRAAAQ